MGLLRILTDRGTEFCGKAEHHNYQLYLAMCDIVHTKTKARSPQKNGICERFHKTILNEFYQIAFRKKIYESIETLQQDLNKWVPSITMSEPIKEKCVAVGRHGRHESMANRDGMKKLNNSTTNSRTIALTV